MANIKKEVVPGLTIEDIEEITNQIFNRMDANHPQIGESDNGFIEILQNGKPAISASPVFMRKVIL